MNLTSLHKNAIIRQKLRVDQNGIIILIPDQDVKVWEYFQDSDFLLTNCEGIMAPSKQVRVGTRMINPKGHYLDLKKQMKGNVERKLQIIDSLPTADRSLTIKVKDGEIPKNSKYIFYDASIYTNHYLNLLEKKGEKIALTGFMIQLGTLYEKFKKLSPIYNIDLLLLTRNPDSKLLELISSAKKFGFEKALVNAPVFDNFIIASNTKRTAIPLAYKALIVL